MFKKNLAVMMICATLLSAGAANADMATRQSQMQQNLQQRETNMNQKMQQRQQKMEQNVICPISKCGYDDEYIRIK